MKTLTITNQKGGVGKTTLVVNFALCFAERGAKVAVVDMDVQGNCSFTLADLALPIKTADLFSGKIPELAVARVGVSLFPGDGRLMAVEEEDTEVAAEHLRRGLDRLAAAGYDVCLLDSPAAFGVRFMAGLLAADFILAPIELEAYSIQGIGNLVNTIANARKLNPRMRLLGMLANKVDRRTPRHARHLEQLTAAYPQLLLPMTIGLRGSIAEALVSGEPVWKNKKTAARTAAQEIRAAADYVFDKMNVAAPCARR